VQPEEGLVRVAKDPLCGHDEEAPAEPVELLAAFQVAVPLPGVMGMLATVILDH